AVFDAIDTVKKCLSVFAPMIRTMKPLPENMYAAAQKGFINATDLADYLVKKGLPFRTAYKLVGQAVAKAIELGKVLDQLPLETLKQFSPLFDQDVYEAISLEACVRRRTSAGGPGPESVAAQIAYVEGTRGTKETLGRPPF
ncbi:MAG: argininosuccinate lyase, partial [Eubacteriales bacterium]|nr:argininosuccinate lyase [Eubacteriales bacterium]